MCVSCSAEAAVGGTITRESGAAARGCTVEEACGVAGPRCWAQLKHGPMVASKGGSDLRCPASLLCRSRR
jgi:hypothetical protein